jgi:hypothetical protein
MARYILVLIAALNAAASSAHADHIPGHGNGDPTFQVPLPGPDFFTGGAIAITAIGPPAGTVIKNTTFDITYVSDGATPASNRLLEISAQVNGDFAEVSVTEPTLASAADRERLSARSRLTRSMAWSGSHFSPTRSSISTSKPPPAALMGQPTSSIPRLSLM